jgi:hypothetical protein
MRKSGQRFLEQYEILQKKNKFMSNKANVYIKDFNRFNHEHWYVQAHEITKGQGNGLRMNINAELGKDIDYALVPKSGKNTYKSRHAVNCCTWCCDHMERMDIPVNRGLIPSATAKKEPKDERTIWQRMFGK